MPSKSKKQFDLMKIASYNKDFADKRKISQDAAREWHNADKEEEKKNPSFYKDLPDHAEEKSSSGKPRTSKRHKERRKASKAVDKVKK